jgi:hypothetical protein
MGRPYRMIVKETTPDSTSESIPEKLAFASFTLIVVGVIESFLKKTGIFQLNQGLILQLEK